MPCPYANLFGIVGQGFHEQRFLGFAFNDIIGTLALAGITSYTTKISFLRSTITWFALAEALHYAFGVRTQFLEQLGIKPICDETMKNGFVETKEE